MSSRAGWTQRSRRYGVERGDTGLGRDAYGPPRHERDRRGYGHGPYPSDDGSPLEDDDAAGPGRRAEDEDDFGQLLRRPGEMPPRQPRIRQPGQPQPGGPGPLFDSTCTEIPASFIDLRRPSPISGSSSSGLGAFFGIVRGERPDRFNWLTPVPVASKQPVGV